MVYFHPSDIRSTFPQSNAQAKFFKCLLQSFSKYSVHIFLHFLSVFFRKLFFLNKHVNAFILPTPVKCQ
jgi:hypothetical protein